MTLLYEAADMYMHGPSIKDLDVCEWLDYIVHGWSTIPVLVYWVDGQPYESYQDLWRAYATTDSFKVSKDHLQLNFISRRHSLWARAVHDWAHLNTGADFSFEGEIKVARWECDGAPESIHDILCSEIIGQAAVKVVTGEFPRVQRFVKGMSKFLPF
jgi:hypothetical protein